VQLFMSKPRNSFLMVSVTGALISVVGAVLSLVKTSTFDAFFGVAAIGRSSHVASLTGRLPLWEEIFKYVERKPLFGHGYGAYWTTKRVEDFAQMFYWEPPNGHSIYVDTLVELGCIGFVTLVGALVVSTAASIATFLNEKDYSHLFAVGILNWAIIHGLTESSFYKGCFGPLWLALAIFTLLRARSLPSKTSEVEPDFYAERFAEPTPIELEDPIVV
jgi:O-antigen ligase